MSRSARVTLEWPDKERTFRLRIGELVELQEKCDAGPMAILSRLAEGQWRVHDIRETIRLGLLGGGAPPSEALRLIKLHVDDRPLTEAIHVAQAILLAAVIGVEDEPLEDRPGEPALGTENGSASPSFTETERSSGGPRNRSTAAASGSSGLPSRDTGERTPRKRKQSA
jgi:hypothetical protein